MKRASNRKKGPTFTPAIDAWPVAGVYQLWIMLRRPIDIGIGALGVIHLTRGMYIYTGRASRGLRARVLRHVQGAKRLHWHIDYLLAEGTARIEKVTLASTNPEDECRVNCRTADDWVATPGFGSSDCRSGCPGHLWMVGN